MNLRTDGPGCKNDQTVYEIDPFPAGAAALEPWPRPHLKSTHVELALFSPDCDDDSLFCGNSCIKRSHLCSISDCTTFNQNELCKSK